MVCPPIIQTRPYRCFPHRLVTVIWARAVFQTPSPLPLSKRFARALTETGTKLKKLGKSGIVVVGRQLGTPPQTGNLIIWLFQGTTTRRGCTVYCQPVNHAIWRCWQGNMILESPETRTFDIFKGGRSYWPGMPYILSVSVRSKNMATNHVVVHNQLI